MNPQFMQYNMVPAAAGTTEQWALVTPINRLPRSGGKVTIMEVLKIWFTTPNPPTPGGAALNAHLVLWCGTNTNASSIADAGNLAQCIKYYQVPTAALSGSMTIEDRVWSIDLTDGAGHGVLVATDTIYVGGIGVAGLWTGAGFRMLYRFKTVSLEEYIGIVQSQQ